MELWFVVLATALVAPLLNAFLRLKSKSGAKLPPGPRGVPIITTMLWLRKSATEFESNIRTLCSRYGPIVTVPVGIRPTIFIRSRSLAHQALIQKGSLFADRPKPTPTTMILSSNQHNINSAGYGPTWRTLRRNLTSEILHPSRAKEFCHARKWALEILLNRLKASAVSDTHAIRVMDHFHFAMFSLLVYMCFGDKLDESKIREIEEIQYEQLTSARRFLLLNRWPRVTRVLLPGRWTEFYDLRKKQQDVLFPRIRARKKLMDQVNSPDDANRLVTSYADTLLHLELSDGSSNMKRKLTEEEMASACAEFLNAGTDTTSTALQWIMANLVKHPDIQANLLQEIKRVTGEDSQEVKEDDLSKMLYLKAVVLEGLRRHPPGHLVLPHAVTQEVELGGYKIPKDVVVQFTVADIGWDPDVWKDPMEFQPDRFLSGTEEFDITGSREIKMMPFGAGRRICPAYGLAILHLEYYVANLILNFQWAAAEGYEVDLSEKQEFTTVMKYPLHALVSPRKNN